MKLWELQAQIALGKDSHRQFKRDVTNVDSLAALARSVGITDRAIKKQIEKR